MICRIALAKVIPSAEVIVAGGLIGIPLSYFLKEFKAKIVIKNIMIMEATHIPDNVSSISFKT